MGLELPDKRHGTLIGQPEESPETAMAHTDMPPFLIDAIIDDEDGDIYLQALIQGFMVLWLASTATEDHCYMPVALHV